VKEVHGELRSPRNLTPEEFNGTTEGLISVAPGAVIDDFAPLFRWWLRYELHEYPGQNEPRNKPPNMGEEGNACLNTKRKGGVEQL
jgi:hypothetical protein